METANTLQTLLAKGKSAHVEFKSASVDLDALGATICAFLNSGGGQLIVGLNDDGTVEGKAKAAQIEEMLRPLSGGGDTSLIVPDAIWDVSEEATADGTVAIIDVPAGADLPYVFRDVIYIRTGKQTRPASGTQTRALIEKRYRVGARWEQQPALEVELGDLAEEEILKTAKTAADKRGWRFRDQLDPWAILEDLDLVNHGRLTNATVVLFAKEAGSIYPQTQVRATAYSSDKTAATIADDQLLSGHLFSHLKAYDTFIQRHITIVSEFSATKTEREDRPFLPYWALREGFRNALMHRDYSSYHGRISISVYPRRFEIWSPGGLPQGLTVSSLKTADRSMPVNQDIAKVVFLRGLVELLGRGTRKIMEQCKSFGLPEPSWQNVAGGISLTMRGGVGVGEIPEELNSRQIDLLRKMRPGSRTDVPTFLIDLDGKISERTARNDLTRLTKLGFIARQGKGKNTFYVRTEKPIA